jgi:hypothetical protein
MCCVIWDAQIGLLLLIMVDNNLIKNELSNPNSEGATVEHLLNTSFNNFKHFILMVLAVNYLSCSPHARYTHSSQWKCTADQTSTSEKHVYIKAIFRHSDVMTLRPVQRMHALPPRSVEHDVTSQVGGSGEFGPLFGRL